MSVADWNPAKLDELGFVGRGKSRHRPRNAAFLYGGRYPFDPDKADVRFIKYYMEILKLRMQNVSHGATQDN